MERRRPQAVVGVIGAEMCGDLQIALHQTLGTSFGAPAVPTSGPKSSPSRPSHPLPVKILLRGHVIFVAMQNTKWCNAKVGNSKSPKYGFREIFATTGRKVRRVGEAHPRRG